MRWFAVLLSASLTLNALLLYKIWLNKEERKRQVDSPPQTVSVAPPLTTRPSISQSLLPDADRAETQYDISQLTSDWQRWQRDQDYATAQAAIHAYLRNHPQDIEALLIEAEIIAATAPLSEAVEHYYGLLALPLSQSQEAQISQRIESLTREAIARLSDAKAWDVLAMFVEPLLQLNPTERRYILALAQAYGQQQQFTLMENTLASLMPNDGDAQRLRRAFLPDDDNAVAPAGPLPDITPRRTKQGIALTRVGDQFLVNAKLNGTGVTLLIDTGASATSITQRQFERMPRRERGQFIGRFTINTAGGQIVAPMYRMASLSIGRYSVNNTTIIVLPMDDIGSANGLLGMNFLREFDFRIDQTNALLYL